MKDKEIIERVGKKWSFATDWKAVEYALKLQREEFEKMIDELQWSLWGVVWVEDQRVNSNLIQRKMFSLKQKLKEKEE
jgi:hypothetical protein